MYSDSDHESDGIFSFHSDSNEIESGCESTGSDKISSNDSQEEYIKHLKRLQISIARLLICSLKFANTKTSSHSNNVFLNWVKIAKAFTWKKLTSYTLRIQYVYVLGIYYFQIMYYVFDQNCKSIKNISNTWKIHALCNQYS